MERHEFSLSEEEYQRSQLNSILEKSSFGEPLQHYPGLGNIRPNSESRNALQTSFLYLQFS
jgi:hypothetical protein